MIKNSHALAKRVTPLLLVLLVALMPEPSFAQSDTRPIFVAIPETFPSIDARAIVVRERGREVLVLRDTEATVDALAMALLSLRRAQAREPSPKLGEIIPLMGFVVEYIPDEHRARLQRTLAALERQPTGSMGTFGPARWVPYRSR